MSTLDSIAPGPFDPFGFIDVTAPPFNAVGDGVVDDSDALRKALAAAAAPGGPGTVRFPLGIYLVSPDQHQPYCIELPGSNLQLQGVKGRSWIKVKAGLVAPTTALLIRQQMTLTIRDLGIDGNWGNAKTEISIGSHNANSTGTINVVDTTGFPAQGTITVIGADGVGRPITYSGRTPTSFTGCAGASHILSVGGAVGYIDDKLGINHNTVVDPQNHGVMIRGARDVLIENCQIRQCYGDGIWLGGDSTEQSAPARNIKIRETDIDMCGRSGIAIGGIVDGVHVADCHFTNIYAQAFDTEPEGSSGYARDVALDRVLLDGWWNPANPARGINSPLSIQGGRSEVPNESNRARQYRVRDCTIKGSTLISDARDVVFEHNRVICDFPGYSYSPIYVNMDCDDIWILDNYIYDRTEAQAGNSHDAAISVQVYSAGSLNQQPAGVHVRGNRIYARRGRHGIKVDGSGTFALGQGRQMQSELGTASEITAAATTVSTPSNGASLPSTTITVGSTAGFPTMGTLVIVTHTRTEEVAYSGKTATTFTGCSGGTSVLHTGDAVSANSLTDSTKVWTADQWRGRTIRIAGTQGTVLSNSPTQLILDPGGWRTMLGNPADPAATPAAGPYSIYGSSALVDVDNNMIDCTDDGFGHGGYGVYLYGSRSGMRVRCHGNQIINAQSDGLRIATVDALRAILHLEITDNIVVDTQPTSTCVRCVNFVNPSGTGSNPFVQKWIMRGNEPGTHSDGTMISPHGGLSSRAVWIMIDGAPSQWAGYASPEGVVTATPGSTYHRLDGGAATTLYVKESAAGNNGWKAFA